MPITLYHGPASPSQYETVCEHIETSFKDLGSGTLLLLTGSIADRLAWQKRLNTRMGAPLSTRWHVQTWDEFLYNIVKADKARAHRISPLIGASFMLKALMQTGVAPAGSAAQVKLARDLLATTIQLKSSGLHPGAIRGSFAKAFTDSRFLDACSLYQSWCDKLYHLDPGDCTLSALEILSDARGSLPGQIKRIVLTDIYPLGPAMRTALRCLQKQHEKVAVDIFYKEDPARADEWLGQAYVELGQSADHQVWIEPTARGKTVLQMHHDESASLHHVMELLKSLQLNVGATLPVVAATTTEHALALCELLAANQVPIQCDFAVPLGQLLPRHFSLDVKSLIPAIRQGLSATAVWKHRAEQAYREGLDKLHFYQQMLQTINQDYVPLSDEMMSALLQSESVHLAAPAPPRVNLTTLDRLPSLCDFPLIICGLSLSALQSECDTAQALQPHIMRDARLHETLATPLWRQRLRLERLHQFMAHNPHAALHAAHLDGAGSSLMPLPSDVFPGGLEIVTLKSATSPPARQIPTHVYNKTKKKTFSLSELQKYVDCPFAYHARYHLKLKASVAPEMDLASDVRGSFVHSVLQKLVGDNLPQYLEGLEYANYRAALLARAGALIEDEATRQSLYDKAPQSVVDELLERTEKTFCAMMSWEAELFKKQLKSTMPKHCEWSFGSGDKGYEVKTRHHVIQITGRIDRIDVHPPTQSFTVIDYKTGELPTNAAVLSGKQLQLPVYIMAVAKLLYPGYEAVAALHYGLKEFIIKGLALKNGADQGTVSARSIYRSEIWDEMRAATLGTIDDALTRMQAGDFAPRPRDPKKMCSSCEYRHMCDFRADESPAADGDETEDAA